MKVAILDDYQNVSMILGNFEKLKKDFDFQVFNQPFENEDHVIEQLKDFEVLLVMRERTSITKKIILNLKNLKLIILSYVFIIFRYSVIKIVLNIFSCFKPIINNFLYTSQYIHPVFITS